MKIKFEWETIEHTAITTTSRSKVFGGWIVNCINQPYEIETSVFVPDPSHEWKV